MGGGKKRKNLHCVAETEMSGGHSCISGHARVASLAEMHASLTQISLELKNAGGWTGAGVKTERNLLRVSETEMTSGRSCISATLAAGWRFRKCMNVRLKLA